MNFPMQLATDSKSSATSVTSHFDIREHFSPRRLTIAMWDQAFVLRHPPGGSFADIEPRWDIGY